MEKHNNDRAGRASINGYAITLHIERASEQILRLEEGSLDPALHRITQAGWLASEWGVSENNRRARHYSTAAGRRQLPAKDRNRAALAGAVAKVLVCHG